MKEPNLEKIVISGVGENWICICGNTPSDDGFYTCDINGDYIEPLKDSKWDGLYHCHNCFRIIDGNTKEVLGQNPNAFSSEDFEDKRTLKA